MKLTFMSVDRTLILILCKITIGTFCKTVFKLEILGVKGIIIALLFSKASLIILGNSEPVNIFNNKYARKNFYKG